MPQAPKNVMRGNAMATCSRIVGHVAAATALAAVLLTGRAGAAEITLMCPPPMRSVMTELIAAFERASGHKVAVVFAPSKAIIARLAGGEKVDVAVLTAQATDDLIKAGTLARRVDLARS